MGRTRPCRICRHWFHPHPRTGDRQHVCSRAACQRERHRRACQRWRHVNDHRKTRFSGLGRKTGMTPAGSFSPIAALRPRLLRGGPFPFPQVGRTPERNAGNLPGQLSKKVRFRVSGNRRQREAPAERAHRLRQRLRGEGGGGQEAAGPRVSWDAVRDAVGLEVAVIIEEIARLLEDVVRDAVHRQVAVPARESRQVLPTGRRDDMVSAARAP